MIMLTIDTAAGTDLDAIMELEDAGFPAAERWSRDSWQQQLSYPWLTVLAARDHRLCGVIALRFGPDLCDLDRVIVDPGSRRLGIARRLVAAGLQLAASKGVPEMILEVRSDNAPAIALYRSYGFEVINLRSNYYGPGADALIMKRGTHE